MTLPIQPPITDERLNRLVRQLLSERAEDVAADALSAHAMAERIATRFGPSPVGRTWVLLAAAMLTALLIGGALAVGGQLRLPSLPSPTPLREWTGPLRVESETMPLVVMVGNGNASDGSVWTDGQDAEVEWIDIGEVRSGGGPRLRWSLELAGTPPRASTLDPAQRVIEYGVVLDGNADGIADCLIAINNDAPEPGDFRVSVTNLTTGATSDRVGPPYGFPIDFSHPDEQSGHPRHMTFFFLGGTAPCEHPSMSVRFYAWASLTESGRVTAWDYAPDAAWLAAPDPGDQP
jgi:hypothetical protein